MNREFINFNRAWKFSLGNQNCEFEPSFQDEAWQDIGLPHSFSIPYFGESTFYIGYGWYRKYLFADQKMMRQDKCVFLQFDGAFQETEVFLNGTLAGSHMGGYTGFCIDITQYLQAGENLVAVRVNNLWNARVCPRAGEHAFSGGLYRDVSLLVLSKLHVDWCGTTIICPSLSAQQATVAIETQLRNDFAQVMSVTLASSILDADARCVAMVHSEHMVAANSSLTIQQQTPSIQLPHLWCPDSPYLYHCVTQITVNGEVLDECDTSFGMRWFSFTKDKGFFLNGEHLYLKGANVHQDQAGWGDAVTHSAITRDVQMIKDCGMNLIRGSHYPHHPFFAKECDRLGVLFWSELCFWGIGGFGSDGYWDCSAYPTNEVDEPAFAESCKATLTEMIMINKNSPSILTWSMGNELFFVPKQVLERTKSLVTALVDLTHQLDPTRPASIGGAQRSGFDMLGDVAGYNGDGATLYLDPGVPSLVAEYGSVVSLRPGKYSGNFGNCQNKEFPWRSGQVLWCGFHHGSIVKDLGKMGMIDYYRLPLSSYYWYRNQYLGIAPPPSSKWGLKSKLLITCSVTTLTNDGTQDCQIIATVVNKKNEPLRSCPNTTFTIIEGNGIFPTNQSITFTKEQHNMVDGKCAIAFRSYYGGKNKIQVCCEGVPTQFIEIDVQGEPLPQGKALVPMVPTTPDLIHASAGQDRLVSDNRPTKVSSTDGIHQIQCATNGDKTTYWAPQGNQRSPFISLDLEKFYTPKQVKLHYSTEKNNCISIFLSTDEKKWDLVGKERLTIDKSYVQIATKNKRGRFVKLQFKSAVHLYDLQIFAIEK